MSITVPISTVRGSNFRSEATVRRYARLSYWASSPAAAILTPLVFVAILFGSGAVGLTNPLTSPTSMLYCFGGIIGNALFALLGMRFYILRSRRLPSPSAVLEINEPYCQAVNLKRLRQFHLLALAALCFNVLAIVMSYTGAVSFTDVESVRAEYTGARAATIWAYPADMLAPFCFIVMAVSIVMYEHLPKRERYTGFAMGIVFAILTSFLHAGRANVINTIIFASWWFLVRPAFGRKILPEARVFKIAFLAILASLAVAMCIISVTRSSKQEKQLDALLWFMSKNVEINPQLLDRLESFDPTVGNSVGEALLYWTHSVPNFERVFLHWDLPPDWIAVFSPVLSRRIEGIISPRAKDAWDAWRSIQATYGAVPNSFGTTWFQMVKSYGRIGALAVSWFLAYVAGWLFAKAWRTRDFRRFFISSLFFAFFFLWFQGSAFLYPVFEWSMLITVLGGKYVLDGLFCSPCEVAPWRLPYEANNIVSTIRTTFDGRPSRGNHQRPHL